MVLFNIVTKDDICAVKKTTATVAVVVYTLDKDELLDKIGVVTEKNPFLPDGVSRGLVMGTVETDDSSLMSRAKQETLEESGYDVKDSSLWSFIGEIYPVKFLVDPVYCYSVNVTGLEPSEILGDGSKSEENLTFSLVTLNESSKINDAIFQSCIFKLYINLYRQDLSNYGITKSSAEETLG